MKQRRLELAELPAWVAGCLEGVLDVMSVVYAGSRRTQEWGELRRRKWKKAGSACSLMGYYGVWDHLDNPRINACLPARSPGQLPEVWKGIFCANFGHRQGKWSPCPNQWHATCEEQYPQDNFPLHDLAVDQAEAMFDDEDKSGDQTGTRWRRMETI
jgi:hypothetical protein